MEMLLLRHGRTAENAEGRYCGRTDSPLCAEGISEARRAGRREEIKLVYSSPLLRARQTAQIMLPNAEQRIITDLREMDFGDFEGRTANEMTDDPVYRQWVDGGCMGVCPNGEGMAAFSRRVVEAFNVIVDGCLSGGDKQLVIMAHGGVLMSVMAQYADEQKQYFGWHTANCQGWRAQIDMSDPTRHIILRDCERVYSI